MNPNEDRTKPNPDWVNAPYEYSEKSLRRIYTSIANPGETTALAHKQTPKHKIKFRKVYKAPGYPVCPKNNALRCKDLFVNSTSPQPAGAYDFSALDRLIADSKN